MTAVAYSRIVKSLAAVVVELETCGLMVAWKVANDDADGYVVVVEADKRVDVDECAPDFEKRTTTKRTLTMTDRDAFGGVKAVVARNTCLRPLLELLNRLRSRELS